MYFDTHAHYDDSRFDADRDEILGSMPQKGISLILNPGCDEASSRLAMEFAEKYGHVWAAVGWHPHEAKHYGPDSESFLRDAAQNPKVVAIGEIGLDYHYDFSPREVQMECFRDQLRIAGELGLPAIVHDREAHEDCLNAARDFPNVRGVFHCFSGSPEFAKLLIEIGWYLSFTGVVTFKNAKRSLEVLAAVPKDRVFVETDAPYQAPVPHRGERNDSGHLPLIARAIASVWGTTAEYVRDVTAENAKNFFKIP